MAGAAAAAAARLDAQHAWPAPPAQARGGARWQQRCAPVAAAPEAGRSAGHRGQTPGPEATPPSAAPAGAGAGAAPAAAAAGAAAVAAAAPAAVAAFDYDAAPPARPLEPPWRVTGRGGAPGLPPPLLRAPRPRLHPSRKAPRPPQTICLAGAAACMCTGCGWAD
eukprot:214201-Chlamydomonas_euryale.AAC.1